MARLLLMLMTLTLPGCLAVPFGYPTWSRTPEVLTNARPVDRVLVLRVSIEKSEYGALFLVPGYKAKIWDAHELHGDDPVDCMHHLGMTWGFGGVAWFIIPVGGIWRHEEEIWLYRPGYRLVKYQAKSLPFDFSAPGSLCVEWQLRQPLEQDDDLEKIREAMTDMEAESKARLERSLEVIQAVPTRQAEVY